MPPGEAGAGRRVVLFDFDGVLVRGDTFARFMRAHYGWWRRVLVLMASPGLLLALPVAPRAVLRFVVHLGLLGLDEPRYRALAEAYAAALVRRPGQFSAGALRALRRHQLDGDRVLVVTGCEQTLVRAVLDGLGVGDVEVLASRLAPGLLGMRAAWHNVGPRKVQLLAEHGVEAWLRAYTDSRHDLPMLALAEEAVLVNASPKLCKRVEKALGRSVLRVEWY